MPSLLRTILSDLISRESDLLLVGSSDCDDDPLQRVKEQQVDVVIVEQGTSSGFPCLDMIVRRPLNIFAISADGKGATAINMMRSSIALDAVDQGSLADAVRRVAHRPREGDRVEVR